MAYQPARAVVLIVSMAWMLAWPGAGRGVVGAQGQAVDQLTAALLVTFARFVEWPPRQFPSAAAPILIGVVADESVALALEATSPGKSVAGRPLAVTRLQWESDAAGVHMLYIGDIERRHLAVLLEQVRTQPVVTVSSLSGFGRAGGMITLTLTDGRISFAVNSRATARSDVRLSSFLLSHATKVSDESPGGPR